MKTIPATILVFDSQSSIEEVKKYIGERVFFFDGDVICYDLFYELSSVSVQKDSISFESYNDNYYESFAVLEF